MWFKLCALSPKPLNPKDQACGQTQPGPTGHCICSLRDSEASDAFDAVLG